MKKETEVSPAGTSPVAQKRVAIYTRTACDAAGSTALKDQERTCREYAKRQNWIVLDAFVRSEQPGKSGLTIDSRPVLNSFLMDGSMQPRPFDVLLAEDPSRLSRNLQNFAMIANRLHNNGIEWQVVRPENSNNPNAHRMFAIHEIVEKDPRENLRARVRRGLVGRVLKGFSVGGSHFGFRTAPVIDDARCMLLGYKLEVSESEAAAVRRIFELYASGTSSSQIATMLNDEHVPPPRKVGRETAGACWKSSKVDRILKDPIYSGRRVWNKTHNTIDSATGNRLKRVNPPEMQVHADVPELRIVSDQMWNRAQERLKTTKGKQASQEVGQLQSEQATVSTSHEAAAGEYFLDTKDEEVSNIRICS